MARIFEKSTNNEPSLSQRIAFGRAGNLTENMTLGGLITWLLSKLAFLKVSSNLSDLNSAGTARVNLGVYSTSQVDTLLSAKQATITSTGWLSATRISSYVDSVTFLCKANRWGSVVCVTGQLKLNGAIGTGDIAFTLPTEMGVPMADIHFAASDAAGSASENIELYLAAQTNQVYVLDASQDKVSTFSFSFII